jgi:uncharacterized membrane protein
MTQFTHLPENRWLVAGGLTALVFLVVSYATAKGRAGGFPRAFCTLLRALVVAALTVCLLDPQWVEKRTRHHKARLAVLFDTSKSMATVDVPGSRLGAARSWIAWNIEGRKPADVELVRYGFSDRLAPDTNGPTAAGKASALAGALESMLAAPGDAPLTGVVLVSDGIETTTASPEAAARRLQRRGIPVHTLLTGTTNEMRDVVVENVQVKRAVPNEAPTRLSLNLRSPGFGGRSVIVQIRRDRDVLAAKPVTLTGQPQRLEVEFTPKQKGFQIYEVAVSPVEGEWLASNNRRLFGLEVIDPTIRVLYMEGTPQNGASPKPEWKYLKDALQSDSGIKVTTLYRQFGGNGQYLNTIDMDQETGERIYPVEHPTKGFPKTLAGLLDYDVVIHSDIKRESFSGEQITNIARLVEEFGGGFVMIGGNSAFGRGGYHKTLLDRIIPVAMEGAYDSDRRDFKVKVPRAAWTHPIVAFSDDKAETQKIWGEKFPILHGMNRMERVKPGATVLATADDGFSGGEGEVVLAVQEVGRGRSMAFTSDTTRSWGEDFETTWGEPVNPRWSLTEDNCDSRYYRRFWVNAVRWLAAGRSGRTNQPVILELSSGYAAPGEAVQASVKVRDNHLRDIPGASVTLYLGNATSSNAVAVARYDAAARAYLASIPLQREGAYIVTAAARLGDTPIGDDRQLLVGETVDREMADLRARPDVLTAVAEAAGGVAHRLDSKPTSQLEGLWRNVPPPTVEFDRNSLWDKPWWLGAILGVLSLEWGIRRWRGLA